MTKRRAAEGQESIWSMCWTAKGKRVTLAETLDRGATCFDRVPNSVASPSVPPLGTLDFPVSVLFARPRVHPAPVARVALFH